jgi:hypothetical protein
MNNFALIARANDYLRRIRARKQVQKQPKPLLKYRVNVRIAEKDSLLMFNHSFIVEAHSEEGALNHPRLRVTCVALHQLGYTPDIHVVYYPEMPMLTDEQASV